MFKTLSEHQRQVVAHGESPYTACLSGGAVRSGKTAATVLGFSLWMLQHGTRHEHAVVGQSIEAIMRNAGFPLIDTFNSIGVNARLSRDLGTRVIVNYGGRAINIWIIGAGDDRARRRIQGATLMGLIVDEVVILPESFFLMAWSRLSVEGAKMWCTFNPDSPRHWFKRKVVDRAKEFEAQQVAFTLDDNPSLTDSTKKRYDSSFTGHWHTRMVKGEWAGASGLIFPQFQLTTNKQPMWRLSFGLDWGVSSVFVGLAVRSRGEKAVVESELYYDARENDVRTESEHFQAFCAWAAEQGATGGEVVWLDPTTPASFKRLLRKRGFVPRNADNDVLPGLVTTAARLANGNVLIHETCTNLIEEMSSYQWDERKTEIGEDAPTKQDDHACDALRYFAHSTGKAFRFFTPTTVQAAGF